MNRKWIKRQSPAEKDGKWSGQPWPASDWALCKDVNGVESLANKHAFDYYDFHNPEIDVERICMFKEIGPRHAMVKKYLKEKK
jgi:hypothetical protein